MLQVDVCRSLKQAKANIERRDVSKHLRHLTDQLTAVLSDVAYIKSDDIVDDVACDRATERLNGILADVRTIESSL